jgi:site-specific recombinase XerD
MGFSFIDEFDLPAVGQFRSEWKDGQRSSAKKLERLRAFFSFAQKRKWVAENPARELKAPKITLCPTLPFTREQMVRIWQRLTTTGMRSKSVGLRMGGDSEAWFCCFGTVA